MDRICRVCLDEEPTTAFHPLGDAETRNLYSECTSLKIEESAADSSHLCEACHSQCLEWKEFKEQAIESYDRMNLLPRSKWTHCLVCWRKIASFEASTLMDEKVRKEFQECTSIAVAKQEEGDAQKQESLCEECSDVLLRWSSFRCQAFDSAQKLGEVSTLNPLENDCLIPEDIKVTEVVVNNEFPEEKVSTSAEDDLLNRKEEDSCTGSSSNESSKGNAGSSGNNAERSFDCDKCRRSFKHLKRLINHQRSHTEARFQCEICGRTFMVKAMLQDHLLAHSGDRTYKCPQCDKSFFYRGVLYGHIREVHSAEKSLICEVCGKPSRSSHSLKRHQLVHSLEKPLKCLDCDKTFKTRTELVSHQRMHSGEKPFTCEICEKKFRHRTGLRIHQRKHKEGGKV